MACDRLNILKLSSPRFSDKKKYISTNLFLCKLIFTRLDFNRTKTHDKIKYKINKKIKN